MIDAKTLAKGRRRYLKLERTDPPDDENPTEEQLTALFAAVFTLMTIYADFALWTPHWKRLAKKRRFSAMIVTELGEYIVEELLGPGSFALWESCWNVFRTACIMLFLVAPGLLRRYATLIKSFVVRYPD